jgi:D-serine dehydratase
MQYLFDGQMEFDDETHLYKFLQTINTEESIQLIEIGLNHATEKGIFSIKEVVTLYNCLKQLKTTFNDDEGKATIFDTKV